MEVKIWKNTQAHSIKEKKIIYIYIYEKQKHLWKRNSYKRYLDSLRVENEGFVETKEQKGQREGKSHGRFWCGALYI